MRIADLCFDILTKTCLSSTEQYLFVVTANWYDSVIEIMLLVNTSRILFYIIKYTVLFTIRCANIMWNIAWFNKLVSDIIIQVLIKPGEIKIISKLSNSRFSVPAGHLIIFSIISLSKSSQISIAAIFLQWLA